MSAALLLLGLFMVGAIAGPIAEVKGQSSNDCHSVHIFIARGSGEAYPGRQGALATSICQGISSCGYTDIGYPARLLFICEDAQVGVQNGTALITAYAANCPSAKIVLTGYSQGAYVIGDILGGGGGICPVVDLPIATSVGLSPNSSPGNQIVAATLFGDFRHTANQPYNVASGASKDGLFPRTGGVLASLNRWEDRLRSWCLITDPVCADGLNASSHSTYFSLFLNDATKWVKGKLG